MTKNEFYDTMCTFNTSMMNFEELHQKWFTCFSYMLKSYKVGFRGKTIKSLFYDFQMSNWKELWLASSEEYKDFTPEQLSKSFCGECSYICDRHSYDRIFRTHWLFIRAYEEELDNIRYPSLNK